MVGAMPARRRGDVVIANDGVIAVSLDIEGAGVAGGIPVGNVIPFDQQVFDARAAPETEDIAFGAEAGDGVVPDRQSLDEVIDILYADQVRSAAKGQAGDGSERR
jgi:hypothetical protein